MVTGIRDTYSKESWSCWWSIFHLVTGLWELIILINGCTQSRAYGCKNSPIKITIIQKSGRTRQCGITVDQSDKVITCNVLLIKKIFNGGSLADVGDFKIWGMIIHKVRFSDVTVIIAIPQGELQDKLNRLIDTKSKFLLTTNIVFLPILLFIKTL